MKNSIPDKQIVLGQYRHAVSGAVTVVYRVY